MNKAFFIDKDGTIVDNLKYQEVIPTDEILEKDILEGLRYIQEKGYKLIIISNQPWIAKGKMSENEVENVFKNVVKKLSEKGINIDDYFYCPHQTSDNCDCKKPKPKMIFEAAEKHNINLNESFMVGDMELDIKTGENAGTKTILVLTGIGKEFKNIVSPTYILKNINEITKVL